MTERGHIIVEADIALTTAGRAGLLDRATAESATDELGMLLAEDDGVIDRAFVRPIARRLDEAHAELPMPELAALLLAVREAAGRAGPRSVSLEALPAAAAGRFRPIQQLLRIAAVRAEDRYGRIGESLRAHLEEVAARPRGAALGDATATEWR